MYVGTWVYDVYARSFMGWDLWIGSWDGFSGFGKTAMFSFCFGDLELMKRDCFLRLGWELGICA
jgi:hypothetical protein